MNDSVTDTNGLLLTGLDGSNPLAFLAALGTLRVLTETWPNVTMRWVRRESAWRPVIASNTAERTREDDVVAQLEDSLLTDFDAHPCRIWQSVLSADLGRRRDLANEVAIADERASEWLGGIGINTWSDGDVDTQLRTTRQDYHVGNIRSIVKRTQASHLRRTLFVFWDYADAMANQSLHLDPSEDRRHAYQWNPPTSDPARHRYGNMLGANRLAIEALPLILTTPSNSGLTTIGFRGRHATDTFWRWPVWDVPLTASTISAVLALKAIQDERPNYVELKARGICCLYESQRILVQKTPNFTPARAVMA
jgi:CRISPR-associated endonuclease/helicase Cas3